MGELQILSMLLEGSVNPDVLNRQKQVTPVYYCYHFTSTLRFLRLLVQNFCRAYPQFPLLTLQTPLMLAAMHGKIACVKKLLEVGANVGEI